MASTTIKVPSTVSNDVSFSVNTSFASSASIASVRNGKIVQFTIVFTSIASSWGAGLELFCGSISGFKPAKLMRYPIMAQTSGSFIGWFKVSTDGGCNVITLTPTTAGMDLLVCGTYICN
jgi:hypothetical protein